MKVVVLGAVVGLGLGFELVSMWSLATEGSRSMDNARGGAVDGSADRTERLSDVGEAVGAPAADCGEAIEARRAERDALRDAIADASEQLDAVERDLRKTGGEAVPWPRDVPEGFDEVSQRATLAAAAAVAGGVLEELDCAEYPCLAMLRFDGRDGRAALSAYVDEHGPGPMFLSTVMLMSGEEESVHFRPVLLIPPDLLHEERFVQRSKEAIQERIARHVMEASSAR